MMRATLSHVLGSVDRRRRFALLLLVMALALITPQLEARGWAVPGGYTIAAYLPATVWLTLLVLGVAAFLAGDWPELALSVLLAAFVAIVIAIPVHSGTLDGVFGAPRKGTPGASAVVTLPGDLIRRPTNGDGIMAAGPVSVVVVQRHHDADGKEALETSVVEGTLRSNFVAGADLQLDVERGDKDAKLAAVLEDLADAEAIYLVGE